MSIVLGPVDLDRAAHLFFLQPLQLPTGEIAGGSLFCGEHF
jgi:hypothetical protein